MPSLRRGVRRAGALLATTATLLAIAAVPAEARTCTYYVGVGPTGVYEFTIPCPGPQDQPVPAPVWVTTDSGPGFSFPEWDFIKVTQGSRVFFANVYDGQTQRLHGDGFDTGIVPDLGAAEVHGVSSLPVGEYAIHDINNTVQGLLIIERGPCIECLTSDTNDPSGYVAS